MDRADADGDPVSAGQDDIAGGSSRAGHRDGIDTIHGDGDDDFVVGDNGSIARVLDGTTERITPSATAPKPVYPGGHAKVRVFPPGAPRQLHPVLQRHQAGVLDVRHARGLGQRPHLRRRR